MVVVTEVQKHPPVSPSAGIKTNSLKRKYSLEALPFITRSCLNYSHNLIIKQSWSLVTNNESGQHNTITQTQTENKKIKKHTVGEIKENGAERARRR